MRRKLNSKIDRKIILKGLGVFLTCAFATTLFFQNCSKVSVSDITAADRAAAAEVLRIGAGEVVVEVGASQFDKTEAAFDVGLNAVPDLKQFWIIDNSGTMRANNLNLSNSFGAMFSANNQSSLYKFNTKAYLFSTAQTLPSYSSSLKSVVEDIANRQNQYFSLASLNQSVFESQLRTSSLNSGQLPGDNVGYSLVRLNSSTTDFGVKIAPVMGFNDSNGFSLVTSVDKPANANTTAFEQDFQYRLSILNSDRVPTTVSSGIQIQQSSTVIDKESGLCAVARILENPSSMYTSSDMLAFTIVTDENDNDKQGLNCLKRSAYQRGNADLVNGKCSEFESAFNYRETTQVANTNSCRVNGQNGYNAEFSYTTYRADVTYRALIQYASVTATTPRTKVSYQTSTPKVKYEEQRTAVAYYNQTYSAATYKFESRRIPVSYYTPECVNQLRDGIMTLVCTAKLPQLSSFVDASSYTTCNNAARALNTTAIIAATEFIAADKLPVCGTAVWQVVGSCSTSDTANCRSSILTNASYNPVPGVVNSYVVGDKSGVCSSSAASLSSNAITVVNLPNITSAYLPVCSPATWVTVASCSISSTCRQVADGNNIANQSSTVLGTIANGSTACSNQILGISNVVSGSLVCAPDSNLVTGTTCTAAQLAAGCTSVETPEVVAMRTYNDIANLKSTAECVTWANSQWNQRVNGANPTTCVLKTGIGKVSTALTFTAAGSSTLNANDSCGSTSTNFFNSLSSANKNLLSELGQATPCKILSIANGSEAIRSLVAANCSAQLASDCSALSYRNCTTTAAGGGTSPATGPEIVHGKVKAQANCSTKCSDLPSGFCEAMSGTDSTVAQFLSSKYGNVAKTISCVAKTPVELIPAIDTFVGRLLSQQASFCPVALDGTKRYFLQSGVPYRSETYVDEFVAGNSGAAPATDLITYIKNKVSQENLNVNFTVFIRRTGDPVGAGNGIDYTGTHYEELITQTGGQKYPVTASSYAEALTSLSSVIRSKLIRSFTIAQLKPHQVITSVNILAGTGENRSLAIGEWTQSGNSITVAANIAIAEGDKISVKFQNDDGYIKAQLKKIFIIDQMKFDQVIKSVEHLKANGEIVALAQNQWLKEDNKITIDSSVVINGGDKFIIKFKNNVEED